MKVSYNWLNEFIDLADLNPQDIGERMSRTGIEVDGVNALGTGLKKIVVGHVLTCEPHPDSDHLSITTVEVGEDERSEEHTSELQSRFDLVCRLLLEKKKNNARRIRNL